MPSEIEVKQLTPMDMIQVAFNKAIEQGGALEVVDRILEQQKWMIQHQEEEAFNAALKRIQMKLKKIPKRGWNPQTQSKYATVEDIDDAIQGLLDEEGMTLSFKPAENANPLMVTIIGTLSLGAYSREYPLPMPADGQGPKGGGVMTRTHATGSAITYGKRYLKNMIFDLRFKEHDDDGNAAGGVSVEEFEGFLDKLLEAKDASDLNRLSLEAIKAVRGDTEAVQRIGQAKNKRLKELKESKNA